MGKDKKIKGLTKTKHFLWDERPYKGKVSLYTIIENIKFYFRHRRFIIKNGYSKFAHWDASWYFIQIYRPILEYIRDDGSYPILDANKSDAENEQDWRDILSEMLYCLNAMDEKRCPRPDNCNNYDVYEGWWAFRQIKANRFFELFSKYFYNLWT